MFQLSQYYPHSQIQLNKQPSQFQNAIIQYCGHYQMILTHQHTKFRSRVINPDSISYKFILDLQLGSSYQGYASIQFDLRQTIPQDQQLFLDFSPKNIQLLKLNNTEIKDIQRNNTFLFLERKLLAEHNIVQVFYSAEYDNDSNGLIKFYDKIGQQYIYTIFEPHNTHRAFPVFDQPNLKATMELITITPAVWHQLVSNQLPISSDSLSSTNLPSQLNSVPEFVDKIKSRDDKPQLTKFLKTMKLSPYVFCINAGPYKSLELDSQQLNIPMRIFSSETHFEILKKMHPIIQQITVQSMRFFNDFLGYKYPFNKYDQIFPGDYEKIAMENVSSSIFTDQYLQDPHHVSNQHQFWMINTMIHQLAHHWFGNLVSVEWWADLWLNEGFAEFLGFYCPMKISEKVKEVNLKESLCHFVETRRFAFDIECSKTVQSVYWQNQNISAGIENFQKIGISYTKGANLLYQSLQLMGQQKWRIAISNYLHKYSFKNATIDNLLEEMSKISSDIDFQFWKSQWLQTKSYNVLECHKSTDNNKLVIIQNPDSHGKLRHHKIRIAFIDSNMEVTIKEEVYLSDERQNLILIPILKPEAIILNYGCCCYARQKIDGQSLAYLVTNYSKIKDTMIKIQLWQYLYFQVEIDERGALNFIDLALQLIEYEDSDCIFEWILKVLKTINESFLPSQYAAEVSTRIFYYLLNLSKAKHSHNRKLIIAQYLCNFSGSELSIKMLYEWITKKSITLTSIPYNIQLQWNIMKKMIINPYLSCQQKNKIIEMSQDLFKRDPSEKSILRISEIRSSCLDQDQLINLYQSLKNSHDSVTLKKAKVEGWKCSPHKDILRKCYQKYPSDIITLKQTLQDEHYDFFMNHLFPQYSAQLKNKLVSINLGQNCCKNQSDLQLLIEGMNPEIKCKNFRV